MTRYLSYVIKYNLQFTYMYSNIYNRKYLNKHMKYNMQYCLVFSNSRPSLPSSRLWLHMYHPAVVDMKIFQKRLTSGRSVQHPATTCYTAASSGRGNRLHRHHGEIQTDILKTRYASTTWTTWSPVNEPSKRKTVRNMRRGEEFSHRKRKVN